jgi:hypothetical protein
MIKEAQERSINQKLTTATKGAYRPLNTIKIPTHNWFYSQEQNELYHYKQGNFKAHPSTQDEVTSIFKIHHTLKVLPADSVLVTVHTTNESHQITGVIPKPKHMWQEIKTPSKMETLLLKRNRRHLQQTMLEGGASNNYLMPSFREGMGINTNTNNLLQGNCVTDYEVPPSVAAWINAVTHTNTERTLPTVVGSLTQEEFQQMFKQKKEGISSDPHGGNYSIWKAMA